MEGVQVHRRNEGPFRPLRAEASVDGASWFWTKAHLASVDDQKRQSLQHRTRRILGPSLEGVEPCITRVWGPENHTLVLFRVRILRAPGRIRTSPLSHPLCVGTAPKAPPLVLRELFPLGRLAGRLRTAKREEGVEILYITSGCLGKHPT